MQKITPKCASQYFYSILFRLPLSPPYADYLYGMGWMMAVVTEKDPIVLRAVQTQNKAIVPSPENLPSKYKVRFQVDTSRQKSTWKQLFLFLSIEL